MQFVLRVIIVVIFVAWRRASHALLVASMEINSQAHQQIAMRLQLRARELAQTHPFRPVLSGGHRQTLIGHFHPHHRSPATAGETVEIKVSQVEGENDRIVGTLYRAIDSKRAMLHVFHGLAGSSESSYMPRAAAAALDSGWDVVLWNHRGCGAGRKLAMETYHAGRSDDIGRAIAWGRETERTSKWIHGVLGYSISGNMSILLAASVVPSIQDSPLSSRERRAQKIELPDFVIAVNPPFDLEKTSNRLSQERPRLYGQRFMLDLLVSLDDRVAMSPTSERHSILRNLAIAARRNLRPWSTLQAFDENYIVPVGGFRDHIDYYERASSGRYLKDVSIPLVILTSEDDPITLGTREVEPRRSFESPWITWDLQKHGGHMGYVDRTTLFNLNSANKKRRWLEERLVLYLNCANADGL